MLKKTKKIIKADQFLNLDVELEKGEREATEFEFVKAKVEAMEDVLSRLQAIVKQNDLKYVEEDYAEGDMDDMAWRSLEEEDE